MDLKDILILTKKINKASKNGNIQRVTLLLEQREKSINNIKSKKYVRIPNEDEIVKEINNYDLSTSSNIRKSLQTKKREMKEVKRNKNAYSSYRSNKVKSSLDIKK